MVVPIEPQRVDPYGQSNPYGLQAVQRQQYVPMQSTGLPPGQMRPVQQAHNRVAVGPLVVGAIAFGLSLVGFMPGSPVFYYSAGGIFAIIGGIRVLIRRQSGFDAAIWAPVLAIVLGSLAVVFMISGIIVHSAANADASNDYSGSVSTAQNGTGTSGSTDAPALPTAPNFAADQTLSVYELSASAVAASIYERYSVSTSPTSPNWPSSVSLATDGIVTFPSGPTTVSIAADDVLKYVVSPDGKYFDLSVSGGNLSEIAIYDSESNEFTWVCEKGAPATCPAGGIQPDSGSSPTTSNT
jgi:hypothetical protein